MWIFAIVTLLNMPTCYNMSSEALSANHLTDTTIYFKKDTSFTVSNRIVTLPFSFQYQLHSEQPPGQTKLTLLNPVLAGIPEGVFELYITTTRTTSSKKLHSSGDAFITILDLYSFTAPKAKQEITINISKATLNAKSKKVNGFIYIRFEGTLLPNGNKSSNAGTLKFSGYKIFSLPAGSFKK